MIRTADDHHRCMWWPLLKTLRLVDISYWFRRGRMMILENNTLIAKVHVDMYVILYHDHELMLYDWYSINSWSYVHSIIVVHCTTVLRSQWLCLFLFFGFLNNLLVESTFPLAFSMKKSRRLPLHQSPITYKLRLATWSKHTQAPLVTDECREGTSVALSSTVL